jgi:hypothetical protein
VFSLEQGNCNSSFSFFGRLNPSVVTVTSNTLDQNWPRVGVAAAAWRYRQPAFSHGSFLSSNQANGDGGGAGQGGGAHNDASSSLTLRLPR